MEEEFEIIFDEEVNPPQFCVKFTDKEKSKELYFDYPFEIDKSGQGDLSIILLYKKDIGENSIYGTSYYKDAENSSFIFGWLIPVVALKSTNHDYAENTHFVKAAYNAYKLLFQKIEISKVDEIKFGQTCELTDFFDNDTVVWFFDKKRCPTNFDVFQFLPALFQYDYRYSNSKVRNEHTKEMLPDQEQLRLKPVSESLKEESFIKMLYQGDENDTPLISEAHSFVKFHVLYQVIEMLISRVLIHEISKIQSKIKTKTLYSRDIPEEMKKVTKEHARINKLFRDYSDNVDGNVFQYACKDFLTKIGRSDKISENMTDILYNVRNIMVHDYRSVPNNTEVVLAMKKLNAAFEILICELLISYQELP